MKGLKEYIAVHGYHFTPELAMNILECKWNDIEVIKASDRVAYYNVSKATLGDLVFLVNLFSGSFSKRRCIRYALDITGDVTKEGYAFNAWLMSNEDIDLRDYI